MGVDKKVTALPPDAVPWLEEEVRQAVRHAIATLGPDGFILSPVDNITVDAPLTWRNIEILMDEWRKHW